MNKLIFAAMFFMLGCGSIIGYFLARWDLQSNLVNPQSAIAATSPDGKPKSISLKPPVAKRTELELKYSLCTETKPELVSLSRFDDRALNDLVNSVCTEKS